MPLRSVVLLALALLTGLATLPLAPAAGEGLGDEGRVGVVADRQGLVFVRPAGRQRWTPLTQRDRIYPGDRIRTETRGPNALDVRLAGGAKLTLGPGALLDVKAAGRFELLEGELEAAGTTAQPLTVALGKVELTSSAPLWVKAREGRLTQLPEAPRWLTGYRAGTSEEWMGSLVVTLDGKQVPLHIGWHKVDVEVLDQVARTTVEQTFVNDTDQRLEGVFRFPLPAEASISGFGMWIGSELVEADVVERERARQIYEDILRRKKDPGLLEWAGGNMFQARVFPIEPRSEKRVRLRYTEVLPLEEGAWRYRYALQSELLRQHPLKELALTVRVASTQPLASVTCPAFADATVSADAHTAQVAVSRRDVTPTSDFEVVGKVAPGEGVTVVTHRRGEDAWFMLLVRPPEAQGQGARTLVPDGGPLDLVVAVDTSGSIDETARKAQSAFLATLLGLLAPDDKVRVCTLDTRVRWMSEAAEPAGPGFGSKAQAFLDARTPRGWSDLDRAFEQLLAKAGPTTQVIYLGDGIPTKGDGDAVALAQRIRLAKERTKATFHAVAPGSTYERGVLEALASLGGGSVRHLREDPAGQAQRLLTEIAAPGLKDMKVQIDGVPVARVYPAQLANLPPGRQHVVLGRMQPSAPGGSGAGRNAKVVVTGTHGGKAVRFETPFAMPADGEGNSFLPRLWARRHLDALMEQGSSGQVKAEVVGFSIEHTILTPYTSLLVLENDEDRERYGVERRVKSRDGEIEFASTRDRATLEATRKALAEAQAWRLRLRNLMQREIARLGRDLPVPVPEVALGEWVHGGRGGLQVLERELLAQGEGSEWGLTGVSGFGFTSFGGDVFADKDGDTYNTDRIPTSGGMGGAGGGLHVREELKSLQAPGAPMPMPTAAAAPPALRSAGKKFAEGGESLEDFKSDDARDHNETEGDGEDAGFDDADEAPEESQDAGKSVERARRKSSWGRGGGGGGTYRGPGGLPDPEAGSSGFELPWEQIAEGTRRGRDDVSIFGFPGRGRTAYDPPPEPEPPLIDEAARAVLLRLWAGRDDATRLKAVLVSEQVHPLGGRRLAFLQRTILRSAADWFVRHDSPGNVAAERSWSGDVVTALDTGNRLARAWPAGPHAALSIDDLARALGLPQLRDLEGAVVTLGDSEEAGTTTLRIAFPPDESVTLWSIAEATGDLLSIEVVAPGRRSGRRTFGKHVEAAGRRWPGLIVDTDAEGRVLARTTIRVEALDEGAYRQAFDAAHAGRGDVLTVGPKEPTLREARQALAKGEAGLEERLVLALDRLAANRHDEAWAHVDAALASHAGKPGVAWTRAHLLQRTRRGEDLKAHLVSALLPLVSAHPEGRRSLAERVLGLAGSRLGATEALALHAGLAQAVTSDASDPEASWAWRWRELGLLSSAGRAVEARQRLAALAAERPYDLGAQQQQAGALEQAGEPDQALAFLDQTIAGGPWLPEERDALEVQRSNLSREHLRLEKAARDIDVWCKAESRSSERWSRRTSLLYVLGRGEDADAWIRAKLRQGARGNVSTEAERAEVLAALQLAMGQGWDFWSQEFAPVFVDDLADAARFHLAQADDRRALASEILGDWRFGRLAAGQALKEALRTEAAQPQALGEWSFGRLNATLRQSGWAQNAVPDATYAAVVQGLEARRAAARTQGERSAWAGLISQLASERGDEERRLNVARKQRESAQGRARIGTTAALLDMLQGVKHTPEREEEAWGLVAELSAVAEPLARRLGRSGAEVRETVVWALPARAEALLGTTEQRAKRSRAEAREVERTSRSTARTALAERLNRPWPEALAPWMALERAALLSENRVDLGAVLDTALGLLDGPPEPLRTADRRHPLTAVVRVIQARAALLATHAATRRGAPPELATRALAAFQERWTRPDGDWRYASFRLLVAFDRIQELQTVLAGWTGEDDVDARWRRAQGYLAAELGQPAQAIQAFEALRTLEGALSAADLETLATWHLVTGDLARRDEAVRARFDALGEWELRGWIEGQRRATGPGGVPGDLPPETYVAIASLLRRADWPQNHLWVVQNLYQGSKDHRALACLAQGLAGHGVQAIYGYLQQAGQLIEGVHEEATLDMLRTSVEEQRRLAKRPEDVRGLALLLARVEARAARVVLKDPSHGERALEALRAAGSNPPAPEELRPLAAYLAQLKPKDAPALAAERTRQLRALRAAASLESGDRIFVARHLADALWSDGQQEPALDALAQVLGEARGTDDPRARAEVPHAVQQQISYLVTRGAFLDAERVVMQAAEQARSTVERAQWTLRLATLWGEGLARGGAFAIGRGEALFEAAQERIEAAWRAAPAQGAGYHQAHMALGDAARKAKLALDVGALRVRFAKERLPAFYVGWPNDVTQRVENEAGALERLASPRASLAFTLDRMDVEPVWYARLDQDAWSQMEWALVQRRSKAEPLGAVGPRLLARVKARLAERVLAENTNVSGFWAANNQHAWKAAFPDLLAAALAASEQRPAAPGVQLACAHHLRVMGYQREAIGVLEAADRRGHLHEQGRAVLLDLLLVAQQYPAALALADRLLQAKPENLTWHKRRARALMGLKRPADAEAALRSGLELAAQGKPPSPALVGDVGTTASDMGLATAAVTWLRDALTRAEQAGSDTHSWAGWRRHLALALANLDRIDEAVQVANLLAVGDRSPHRASLDDIDDGDMPEEVLLRAKDLPAYVARFEAEVAKSGTDVPVLRKALARVFAKRKDPARAVRQLEALREVVPDDTVVLRWMVQLYDALGRPDDARAALDALLTHAPGDVAAWEDLGRRLAKAGQAEEAERAFTNAVEMRPLEPDGHRLMARLALEATQPAEAAAHWHNVTRVRPLEPEGRLAEAGAWIQAGQPAKARPLLQEVVAGSWEERFGDVKTEAGRLLSTLK